MNQIAESTIRDRESSVRCFRVTLVTWVMLSGVVLQAQDRPVEFVGGVENVQASLDSSVFRFSRLSEYVLQKIPKILSAYGAAGYLFARIDSVVYSEDVPSTPALLYLTPGHSMVTASIHLIPPDSLALVRAEWRVDGNWNAPDRFWKKALQSQTRIYADNGYPMVKWTPAAFLSTPYNIEVTGSVNPGRRVILDTMVVTGASETKPEVLIRELRLTPRTVFRERNVRQAARRLGTLPYVASVQPPLLFRTISGKYGLLWRMTEQKANLFDGILGYVPATDTRNGYFTGQLQFDFVNLLGTGRQLHIFWSKRDVLTQEMNLAYTEPWVAGFPISLSGAFSQTVQDSTYIKRSLLLGGEYQVGWRWRLYGRLGKTEVLTTPEGRRSYNLNSYRRYDLAAGLEFNDFDDLRNPTRGWMYRTELNRRQGVAGMENTLQAVDFEISAAQPLWGRQVLWFHGRTQNIISPPDSIPVSELFRFGGASSVRGYAEDLFLGTTVAWINVEYRYLFEKSSRIITFLDYGYWEKPKGTGFKHETIQSIGAGIRAATPVGQLGIDYALPPHTNWKQGRIHVRWQNYF